MDGSGARRRTLVTAVAVLTLTGAAMASLGAVGAVAQSAGDEQYADPLADGEQRPQESPPAPDGGTTGDQPSAPAPAPSTPDTSIGSDAPSASVTSPAGSGETLPRTGAEPAPIALTGLLLLVGGALLRRRTPSRATR